jgi:FtsP/CotA-like multicopper oxidase with cupredoxin domain
MLSYADLTPAAEVRLVEKAPDRQFKVDLVGDMSRYVWGIAGRDAARLQVRQGERISIAMTNTTDMWHPMHLHGHTFAVDNANGIRKDTVIVLPKQTVTIQFDATNPGQWMFHCHNAYHMEAGMTTNLYYLA